MKRIEVDKWKTALHWSSPVGGGLAARIFFSDFPPDVVKVAAVGVTASAFAMLLLVFYRTKRRYTCKIRWISEGAKKRTHTDLAGWHFWRGYFIAISILWIGYFFKVFLADNVEKQEKDKAAIIEVLKNEPLLTSGSGEEVASETFLPSAVVEVLATPSKNGRPPGPYKKYESLAKIVKDYYPEGGALANRYDHRSISNFEFNGDTAIVRSQTWFSHLKISPPKKLKIRGSNEPIVTWQPWEENFSEVWKLEKIGVDEWRVKWFIGGISTDAQVKKKLNFLREETS